MSVALIVAAIATIGLAFSGSAAAASFYPFDETLESGSANFGFLAADGIAINDSNSQIYLADSNPDQVRIFNAAHSEIGSLDGSTAPAGSFGEGGKPISVAANNADGNVYVLDATHEVVDVFDSAGNYLCQITGSASPSATECNGVAGSATPSGGFSTPQGLAIDQATGEIYVLDAENAVIDVFTASGAYATQFELSKIPTWPEVNASLVIGIAVSSKSGNVYVDDTIGKSVHVFAAGGEFLESWTGENTANQSFEGELSVAVDNADGTVLVSDPSHQITDAFTESGALLTEFAHEPHVLQGTAVDQETGRVFVANLSVEASESVIDIFGPALTIPDVATGETRAVSATGATLEGSVNPDEIQLTGCEFEYGTTTAYGAKAPCIPAASSIPADGAPHVVEAEIANLQPGAEYHYRLVAANANGANHGSDAVFSTLPRPTIQDKRAEHLTATTADLKARINPNGSETTYRFEWGETTSYDHAGPDRTLAAGNVAEEVEEALTGLNPNTHYHWRIVATNENGATDSPDESFTYAPPPPPLPDGRAYELVSPVKKNGAVIGNGLLIVASDVAANGERLIVSSIQCFSTPTSCTAVRENEGDPYALKRTATGWVTTPLAPPTTEANASSSWFVDADTGRALFSSATPPDGQDDFFTRNESGESLILGPATPPADGEVGPLFGSARITTTPNMSHVAYELESSLWPFDQSEQISAYELSAADPSQPVLVAVSGGSGSTALLGKCGARLGREANHHEMSEDGQIIYVTVTGHDDSSFCPENVPAPATFEVYARVNASETVPISQRSPGDCTTPSCTTSKPADAGFEDASADGKHAFFLDTQQLTDTASEDGTGEDSGRRCTETVGPHGCNLYEYDFEMPEDHRLIDISTGDTSGLGPEVQRVFATAADGSRVYFVAHGVLTEQANGQGAAASAGAENLYVYERNSTHPTGHINFIGILADRDTAESANGPTVPSVSPDGEHLAFVSHADLTSDDTSAELGAQVFEYTASSGDLVRVSIGQGGFNNDGNLQEGAACEPSSCPLDPGLAPPSDVSRRDPSMSDDGAFVFFQSPVGLTPRALNEVVIGHTERSEPIYAENIYEYHDGQISLISDGKDTAAVAKSVRGFAAVELIGSDASGANVFFSTADPLVAQDTDSQLDYYDARIGGGFPASPEASPCGEATACRGGAAPSPVGAGAPASSTYAGSGNVVEPKQAPAPAKPSASAHARALARSKALVRALKACKRDRRKKVRQKCEAAARKQYRAASATKSTKKTHSVPR